MNILFITTYYPEPKIGGIERVTYLLSKYLSFNGNIVFNLRFENSEYDDAYSFINSNKLESLNDAKLLRDYLIRNNISVVINQSHFFYTPIIKTAKSGLSIRLFTVFHNMPMFKALDVKEAIKYSSSKIKFLIPLIYPLYSWYSIRKLRKEHKCSYELSDKTILLSIKFIDIYKKELEIDGNKLIYINNPLSFENIKVDYNNKEKIVLIVSRLYEAQKKLTTAFNIWSSIEKKKSRLEINYCGRR